MVAPETSPRYACRCLHGEVTVPLGSPRRIFARQPRLHLGTLVPWVVVILLLAGASAAAGAILAENAGADRVTFGVAAAR
jgi:hypothetical protein